MLVRVGAEVMPFFDETMEVWSKIRVFQKIAREKKRGLSLAPRQLIQYRLATFGIFMPREHQRDLLRSGWAPNNRAILNPNFQLLQSFRCNLAHLFIFVCG